MKSAKPTPVLWMPPLAFLYAWMAPVLLSYLRDRLPWESKYWAALAVVGGVACVATSVRECVGLWRASDRAASYPLLVTVISLGVFSGVGSAVAFLGSWHWEWLIPGLLAVYFVVVFARERGRLAQPS